MAVVHQRIDALAAVRLDEGTVGRRRLRVRLGRAGVVAGALEDVRRHVHEMSGRRRRGTQPLRTGERALRMRRRLDGVDVVVIRAEVMGVALQHRLQRADDGGGSLGGVAVVVIELPWVEVHHRLGVERGDVVIRRILLRQLAHGRAVVDRELLQIGVRIVAVTLRQRLDEVALLRRGVRLERLRLLHRLDRAEGEGDAPPRHGEIRIELAGALERLHRRLVIEAVEVLHALIEELLRLGALRRHRAMKLAEPRIERDGGRGGKGKKKE